MKKDETLRRIESLEMKAAMLENLAMTLREDARQLSLRAKQFRK